jgi:outer membrane protein TolC
MERGRAPFSVLFGMEGPVRLIPRSLCCLTRRLRLRMLTAGLATGLPLLAAGCQHPLAGLLEGGHVLTRPLVQPASQAAEVVQASFRGTRGPEVLPAPHELGSARNQPPPPAPAASGKMLPITMDTVLRLAEEQNAQVALAREKLNESLAQQALASKSWLPQTTAGIGYYRHEGGIQAPNGQLLNSSFGSLFPGLELRSEIDLKEAAYHRVNAERQHWQTRGELSRITSETLVEAGSAYIDLLTARRGEAVARELEKYQQQLLEQALKIYADDKTAAVAALVASVRAELLDRQRLLAKLRQQGDQASAKLGYLLGLPPDVCLVPVDEAFTPVELVDATAPVCDLVNQALASGPGVEEMQRIIAAIQGGIDQANGPGRFMPNFQVNAIEGPFLAGGGGALSATNRFDLGLQAKWNLLDWVTARERLRLAESKLYQAQLNYRDLQGKLTSGVQQSQTGILAGRDQIRFSAEQIRSAAEAYQKNQLRLKEQLQSESIKDTLNSIRLLDAAHFGYLLAVNAHNKAQVQLMVLLGPGQGAPCKH